ncbi:hypothetical protein [Ideonella sp. BN130291]|uniref:hypothetical protein n=1 Tax=Ideonella sp. BN130291 TaxID=3112940 RepID=UPI002E26B496|nr:hypothetical protein [Ideonella sp. BN130291]
MTWLCLALGAPSAVAAEPLTVFNVVLLQSSTVLEERVASVDAMAEYVKAVEAAAREAVSASSARQSVGGFIVVAVRPGQQSKVWLDFDALLDLALKQQIAAKVASVQPFEARQGPVVFALKVALWDGKATRRTVPLPAEWKNARRDGAPMEVGELVDSLWDQ